MLLGQHHSAALGLGKGCMVVADLEQQGGQGLDISLWHFPGPLVAGYSEGPWGLGEDWKCPGGSLPCRGEVWQGLGGNLSPLGWGLPTLLCSHTASFFAPRRGWLGLADWVFKTFRADPKEAEKWVLPLEEFTTQMKGQEQPHGDDLSEWQGSCQVWTCRERTEEPHGVDRCDVLAPGAHRQAGPRTRSWGRPLGVYVPTSLVETQGTARSRGSMNICYELNGTRAWLGSDARARLQ